MTECRARRHGLWFAFSTARARVPALAPHCRHRGACRHCRPNWTCSHDRTTARFPGDRCRGRKASSPVAAVVSAMRRVDPDGGGVAANQVRAADTLMTALYTAQPVRWDTATKTIMRRAGCGRRWPCMAGTSAASLSARCSRPRA